MTTAEGKACTGTCGALCKGWRGEVATRLDQAEQRALAQCGGAGAGAVPVEAAAGPADQVDRIEPTDQVDYKDLAGRAASAQVSEAAQAHARRELAEIAAARARLAAGDYGICADCGQGIPQPRLLACPTARRCLPCQRQHERLRPGRP